jgi:hypothetical protein
VALATIQKTANDLLPLGGIFAEPSGVALNLSLAGVICGR